MKISATRVGDGPLIAVSENPALDGNVNGPSLIRVPGWMPHPLGRYYLYFAHHQGHFIRLAYADELAGPWSIYPSGVLPLEASFCIGHVGSPDVHVDHERQEIRLYYHGPVPAEERETDRCVETLFPIWSGQRTKVAFSSDGLHFVARPQTLGGPYFRVFRWQAKTYALAMPGIVYESDEDLHFRVGPALFTRHMRHSAVLVRGNMLYVFYSNAFDCPERILCATVALVPDVRRWQESQPTVVLEPECDYEGGDLPLVPSQRGIVHEPVRQLRDPAIYEEDGRVFLLYAVAGEQGIALAELTGLP